LRAGQNTHLHLRHRNRLRRTKKIENSPTGQRLQTVLPQNRRLYLCFYFQNELHLTTQLHLARSPRRIRVPPSRSKDEPHHDALDAIDLT
jgi:hypothetical protein